MPDETSLFDRAIPVLASLDIAASLDYFNKLGFETHDFGDHNYGIAIREHIELHFWLCPDKQVAENTSCYIRVNDIDALRADFSKRIKVTGVVKTPWGMDELYVYDPSGSLVKFGMGRAYLCIKRTISEALVLASSSFRENPSKWTGGASLSR